MSSRINISFNSIHGKFGKHIVKRMKHGLSEFVRDVMKTKNLSFRDVERKSNGTISYGTVAAIKNKISSDVKNETLVALAKGLGVPEEQIFNVARGLPPVNDDAFLGFVYENYNGEKLNDKELAELKAFFVSMIKSRSEMKENERKENESLRLAENKPKLLNK